MTSINIIGTGNVALHIAQALQKLPRHYLQGVGGRSTKSIAPFIHLAKEHVLIKNLNPANITIIAVSDDAIKKVLEHISYTDSLFVHTSGSVAMEALSCYDRYGVFYPLQSFSKKSALDFNEVPLCLESKHPNDLEELTELAFALSEKVIEITTEERKKLHLAAVFVNNFSNHCFTIAQELCGDSGMSFDLLRPLLAQTAQKALNGDPSQMQTGPAKRNDTNTINAHLDQLTNEQHKEVYLTISKAITSFYEKKL